MAGRVPTVASTSVASSRLMKRLQPSTSALAAPRAPVGIASAFAGLRLGPSLLARVQALGASEPLPIQQAAVRRIFAGESVALHSQTGSGKTLAYMLPLLARLRRDPVARVYIPRQALIVCPSRELAMQSCEYARRLQPGSAAVVSGTRAKELRDSLLREPAPLVFATSRQLGALHELLAPDDEEEDDLGVLPHVVRKGWYRKHTRLPRKFWQTAGEAPAPSTTLSALRATLRTLVIDEADTVLAPRGKGGMRNRSRRNKSLELMPSSLAVRKLLARHPDAAHPRVQLVLASATLSRISMRDLRVVADRRAGKIALVTPAMAELSQPDAHLQIGGGGAMLGASSAEDEEEWEWDDQLEAIEEAEAAERKAAGKSSVDASDTAREARAAALEESSAAASDKRALPARSFERFSLAHGSRGGVLHQGVPSQISHEMIICDAHRKSEVIAELIAEKPGPALLVVRDRLRVASVLDELKDVGIEGAMELGALGAAAAHHHALAAVSGAAEPSDDALAAAPLDDSLPEWASTSRAEDDEQFGAGATEGAATSIEAMAASLGGGDTMLRVVKPSKAPAVPGSAEKQARAAEKQARAEEERKREKAAREELVRAAGVSGLVEGSARWPLIVAHESAVRGLDMPHLRLVILTSMPDTVESYIHVAGRTGRAGESGRAVSVFTPRERKKAGLITSALQDVRWKVTIDDALDDPSPSEADERDLITSHSRGQDLEKAAS